MGCDCHFYVERWTSSNNYEGPRDASEERDRKIDDLIGGAKPVERWVSADRWEFEGGEWHLSWDLYGERNYQMFALLADVRNGGLIDPISEPRGIPDDASAGYLYKARQWDMDGHSHTYYTLQELLEVDWESYDFAEGFIEAINAMKEIDDDPNKVRCCMFFDN
jgi:hypothetical protein